MDYKFSALIEDLKIGREIEFEYKNNQFSITNNGKNWIFADDTQNEYEYICKFEDMYDESKSDFIINYLKNKKIIDNTVDYIFDNLLYCSLYIL